MDAPRLTVYRPADRPHYVAQWTDPATGRKRTRTLKTADRRAAERAAGLLSAELAAGIHTTRATWDHLAAAYTAAKWPALAPASRRKIQTTLDLFAEACRPTKAAGLNATTLAAFARHLRQIGRTESTLAGHLRNLSGLAKWATAHGYLPAVPPMPPKSSTATATRARGRPITPEELDRFLTAAKTLGTQAVHWQHLIRGLYLTGLRLSEALALDWTAPPIRLAWTEPPTLEIDAHTDKSRRASILPLTPEAVRFFAETPTDKRRGKVFRPTAADGRRLHRLDTVSATLSRLGRAARIVVSHSPLKFASAHDLRRSFALRLAPHIRPPLLQLLMRHQSIQTTLTYYATADALAAARELWTELETPPTANNFANIDEDHEPPTATETHKPAETQ
jgi:integrase